jgi:hypothetical protein
MARLSSPFFGPGHYPAGPWFFDQLVNVIFAFPAPNNPGKPGQKVNFVIIPNFRLFATIL